MNSTDLYAHCKNGDYNTCKRDFNEDCVKYAITTIEEETGTTLNEKAVNPLVNYAWQEGHSSGHYEVVSYLIEVVDMTVDLINEM